MAAIRAGVLWMVWLCPLPAAGLCVTNGTDGDFYFTVEAAQTGTRITGWLGPDGALCLSDSDQGIVAAFDSERSIEGCSRLARDGDYLLAFDRFDRCTWASHLKESQHDDD